jgi:hypothetical protein
MSVSIVKPTVTISGLDLGNNVDSLEVVETINQLPTATVSLHKTSDASVLQAPLSAEFLTSVAAIQATRVDGVTPPEVTVKITLSGDEEGEYEFRGLPIGPDAQLSDRMFSSGVRLIHTTAKLNVLQPYVYGAVPYLPGDEQDNTAIQAVAADNVDARGGNFVQRLTTLLSARIERFEALTNAGEWYDGATQAYVLGMHARNKNVIDILNTISENSEEPTYNSLEEALSDTTAEDLLSRGINQFIGGYIDNAREDFMSNFFGFLNAIQSYYTPPSVSQPAFTFGRIRPLRTMLGSDGVELETKEVSPTYIGVSSADTRADTVTTVMVTGVPATPAPGVVLDKTAFAYIPPSLNFSTFHAVNSGSPDGNAITVPLPAWLSTTLPELVATPTGPTNENVVDIAAYKAKKDGIVSKMQNIYRDAYDRILNEYATNILYDTQYAPYSILMRIPIDFTWTVGTRYNVVCRRKIGDVVFSGFLQTAVHRVVSKKGAEEAFTTLTFTHTILV